MGRLDLTSANRPASRCDLAERRARPLAEAARKRISRADNAPSLAADRRPRPVGQSAQRPGRRTDERAAGRGRRPCAVAVRRLSGRQGGAARGRSRSRQRLLQPGAGDRPRFRSPSAGRDVRVLRRRPVRGRHRSRGQAAGYRRSQQGRAHHPRRRCAPQGRLRQGDHRARHRQSERPRRAAAGSSHRLGGTRRRPRRRRVPPRR